MMRPLPPLALLLLLPSLLGWSRAARAAACCGTASAAPSVITGDDRAQLSATLSWSRVIGDAPASGLPVFRGPGDDEDLQTLRIDGATLVADRWQLGAGVPVSRRARSAAGAASSSSGLGDVALSIAYEALPEWDYSPWRPHGLAFAQLTLPTGGSIYGSTDAWATDARGRGFLSASAGALLLKAWGGWDASLLAETHRSFAREFTDPSTGIPFRAQPGWGASASLGGGFSPRGLPLRIGAALSPAAEAAIDVTSADPALDSQGNLQLVWTATAQVSWMPSRTESLSLAYVDQTLLGPARNTTLSRGLALSFQQRWER